MSSLTAQHDLTKSTAIVTGASRGLGRGIAHTLIDAGATVVGVARTDSTLQEARADLGERFIPVTGDATDAELAARLLEQYRPDILVLAAGAVPHMAPLQEQTWESFGKAWETDTRSVFEWTRAALRRPMPPGSTVVTLTAGAALMGSPLSGGYAGAKATVRFIAGYAADESQRAGLAITFPTVVAMLTPLSAVGAAGAAAYTERDPDYLTRFQPYLTPDLVGRTVLDLITGGAGTANPEVLLTGAGPRPMPPTATPARSERNEA